MTFTPDRRKRKAGQRARRATLAPRLRAARKKATNPTLPTPKPGTTQPARSQEPPPNNSEAPGTNETTTPTNTPDTNNGAATLAEQLKDAGLDLTNHELADVFNNLDPVTTTSPDDLEDPTEVATDADTEPGDTSTASDCSRTESGDSPDSGSSSSETDDGAEPENTDEAGALPWTTNEPLDDDDQGTDEAPAWDEDTPTSDDGPTSDDEQASTQRPVSPHPLIANDTWSDLTHFAPEVTDSITTLMGLNTDLRTFTRPMGPGEALKIIDAAEALTRISQALSTTALSVYERIGTPTDSGAKDTKALIRDRLNLTGREADRRAKLAKNLGGRVNTNGQALPPQHPVVADKLHDGTLSTDQVTTIEACLADLPFTATEDMKTQVEADLVAYAPKVAVRELREIFRRILAHLDPDGTQPIDETKRENYFVTARPTRNGDWKLDGILDPTTGAELHGLLTSRIESTQPTPTTSTETPDANPMTPTAGDEAVDGGAFAPNGGLPQIPGQERFNTLDAVFTGDRHDAPPWAVFDATTPDPAGETTDDPANTDDCTTSSAATSGRPGYGVRTDGTEVNVTDAQPTARTWIYERFATLIGRISMKEAEKGSPYALVITAKATDIATGTGEARTGAGDRIPLGEVTSRGLDGRVFFNLMGDTGRTVAVRTENRFANKHQTAIITARDRGCIFPGCDSPPGWCDVNHVVPHAAGGKTDINNLCLLCSAHHHLLDRSDWEITMLDCGRPAAVPPPSIDPAKRPILHSRFIADDIIETLFND